MMSRTRCEALVCFSVLVMPLINFRLVRASTGCAASALSRPTLECALHPPTSLPVDLLNAHGTHAISDNQ